VIFFFFSFYKVSSALSGLSSGVARWLINLTRSAKAVTFDCSPRIFSRQDFLDEDEVRQFRREEKKERRGINRMEEGQDEEEGENEIKRKLNNFSLSNKESKVNIS
jgi:hypothetical protein